MLKTPFPFEWPPAAGSSPNSWQDSRIFGEGPFNPLVSFVGEAYGREEEEHHRPFVGSAGKLLFFSGLKPNGLKREEVYLTNLINTRPARGSNDISAFWDGKRLTSQGSNLAIGLRRELQVVSASIIVPLGAVALAAVCGEQAYSITKMRGSVLPGVCGAKFVVPSLHPSGILQSGDYMDRRLLAADIRKALALARGEIAPLKRHFVIDPDFDQAIGFLRSLRTVGSFSFDIETPGGRVLCIGFADSATQAFSINYDPVRWGREQLKILWEETKQTLECSKVRKITQNGNFDTFWLRFWNGIKFDLSTLDDTMLLHHIAQPDLKKSLAMLTSLYTCEKHYKDDGASARAIGSLHDYMLYNAKDAAFTFEIWEKIKGWQEAYDGLLGGTYAKTMKLLPDLQEMQSNGFAVDRRRWEEMKGDNKKQQREIQSELEIEVAPWVKKVTEKLRQAEGSISTEVVKEEDLLKSLNISVREKRRALKLATKNAVAENKKLSVKTNSSPEVIPPPLPLYKASSELKALRLAFRKARDARVAFENEPVNVQSPMMRDLFYNFHGVVPFKARGKRKPGEAAKITLDDDALANMARGTTTRKPIRAAQLIRRLRGVEHEADQFLNWSVCEDGRYRCEYNPRGTPYGRFSSNQLFFRYGTNGQNMPPRIRSILVADPPDTDWFYLLATNDKKQIEWVIVAYRAEDEGMISALAGDTHAKTAALMSGATEELVAWESKLLGKETSAGRIEKLRAECQKAKELSALLVLPSTMSLRQMGKKANHALNYGEGAMIYSIDNEISIPEAEKQIALYHKAYPGVKRWHSSLSFSLQEARLRGDVPKITTCLGRVIPFHGDVYNGHYLKSAFAAEPQATAVDSINPAMGRVRIELPTVQLRAQTHDDITVQLRVARRGNRVDEAARLSDELKQLTKWMSPELEIKGRKFTVGNELKLGMNMGDFQPAGAEGEYSNPFGMRECGLEVEEISERLTEIM